MRIELQVNGARIEVEVGPGTSLLHALRQAGLFSVKHGCESGDCGSCAVLADGKLINTCSLLAVQAVGKNLLTAEGLGSVAQQGWKTTSGLHPLQEAFVELGAIQCGYCTPAMLLAAKSLLDRKGYGTLPHPPALEVDEIREALGGVLCRCTGYVKPVEAVLMAAARMRGEDIPQLAAAPIPVEWGGSAPAGPEPGVGARPAELLTRTFAMPGLRVAPQAVAFQTVGKPEAKVDAVKLVQGKPAFTDDVEMRGLLIAKVLLSPVAHARIARIDASRARALPGIAAVLTYRDLPRVAYSTAGQSDPIPGPLDCFSLDSKVRFVGDRVAFVAAETEEIAEQALGLIEVEYEELPAILDPREAMKEGAVRIHDEPDYVPFGESDPSRNVAAHLNINIGNVEQGFHEADLILEGEYVVPKVQQASIEPHVAVSYWDEDDRLTIRTSTQVPFHARRILAPVLGLPLKRLRVIKPRIGGGFGGKQEVLVEDVAAHLTIATGRPVRFEYSRVEEFSSARSRHPMRIRMKTGVKRDGSVTANEMYILSDTGANGAHALTVTGNTGQKAMALYVGDGPYRESPNIHFQADVVYTNTPPSGAFRGYGVPQGFFAVEAHMERLASALSMDPIQFRLKNALRAGELQPFSRAWSEGREPRPEYIRTCGLEECAREGAKAISWDAKRGNARWHQDASRRALRRGIGCALVMQGTAIPYLDMGAASLKINDDGSFNLLVGATDLGTGSDTVLAQMAAEVLGCPLEDVIVYSSDTDFTPFDKGAYASSTTYISGEAVVRAAQEVKRQIQEVAAELLAGEDPPDPASLRLAEGKVFSADGRSVTLAEIALRSLHHSNQRQIMAVASYMSPVAPPPFAAQFAEVTVDDQTGEVRVENLVMAVDAGVIVNPLTAAGQVEGGMTQALGYAVCEEMRYDERGRSLATDLRDYHIFAANEMPELKTIFVETFEPSHSFGVKAVAEIPMDGVAPAVVNAIHDAMGIWINEIPATPDRVWRAMKLGHGNRRGGPGPAGGTGSPESSKR
ncbi:MAG: molybdopterin cofactor-binding domain-containing protein [Anaerolineales bacterium]|jgi:putative selenate reductase molybdopterin-binding subunit